MGKGRRIFRLPQNPDLSTMPAAGKARSNKARTSPADPLLEEALAALARGETSVQKDLEQKGAQVESSVPNAINSVDGGVSSSGGASPNPSPSAGTTAPTRKIPKKQTATKAAARTISAEEEAMVVQRIKELEQIEARKELIEALAQERMRERKKAREEAENEATAQERVRASKRYRSTSDERMRDEYMTGKEGRDGKYGENQLLLGRQEQLFAEREFNTKLPSASEEASRQAILETATAPISTPKGPNNADHGARARQADREDAASERGHLSEFLENWGRKLSSELRTSFGAHTKTYNWWTTNFLIDLVDYLSAMLRFARGQAIKGSKSDSEIHTGWGGGIQPGGMLVL